MAAAGNAERRDGAPPGNRDGEPPGNRDGEPPGERAASPAWLYAVAVGPAAAVIAAVWLQPWVKPGWLLRDPLFVAATADACCRMYYGLVSNLGVLVWCATAAVCLFAALQLRRRQAGRRVVRFFLLGGLLTGLLLMDDLFFGHESVYPRLLGIDEAGVVAGYVVLTLGYLWAGRGQVRRTDHRLLALALLGFAASAGVDIFLPDTDNWLIVVEDGGKLVGITSWAAYHIRAAWLFTGPPPG